MSPFPSHRLALVALAEREAHAPRDGDARPFSLEISTRRITMKHPARICAALAAIALGAPAAPALANGFDLHLAQQSQAVVGRPMVIQATGTIPPDQTWAPY